MTRDRPSALLVLGASEQGCERIGLDQIGALDPRAGDPSRPSQSSDKSVVGCKGDAFSIDSTF